MGSKYFCWWSTDMRITITVQEYVRIYGCNVGDKTQNKNQTKMMSSVTRICPIQRTMNPDVLELLAVPSRYDAHTILLVQNLNFGV